MKKLLISLLATAIIVSQVPVAFAITAPTIDPYSPVVNAPKIKITGKTDPNAKIIITGGPYHLPPIYADGNGKFEVTLALAQETSNLFSFVAEDKNGNRSEAVEVIIQESVEEAKREEGSSGKDLTAPDPPEIDKVQSPIDANTYKITGTAEKNTKIEMTGDDIDETNTNSKGEFEITVNLKQNKKNTFYISAIDSSGNVSTATKVEIIEESKNGEENGDKNEEEPDQKEIAPPFQDIAGHWGEPYIENLRLKGIISGKSEGYFAPNDPITRAELTKIALNAAEIEIEEATEGPFPDVALDSWYINYIYTAKKRGMIEGFPDGYFRPNNYISRAATLKILLEAAGKAVVETDDNFNDCPKGEWFSKYTSYAKSNNIVEGYKNDGFHPGDNITRAEAVKITVTAMGF